VRGEEDLSDDMQAREPEYLTDLALIGRIGLEDANRLGETPAVLQPRQQNSEALLESLRQSGVLPRDNGTNIDAGIYQSSTGEIVLNRFAGQLRVATTATEAAAFSSLREPIDLGVLRIEGADGNGLVAVSALDGEASLSKSRRFLLIFATDAQNTGMTFRDTEEKVIEDFGRLPVLIREGYADLSLERSAASWSVSPVGLDGTVHPPVVKGKGAVAFRLSNDVPSGPTTYFLLELQ